MPLYTFFLEYDGETYISQVSAPSYDVAPKLWAEKFDLHTKKDYQKYFEKDFQEKLIESFTLNLLTEIEGVTNTWGISAFCLDKPALIHFTQTFED